MGIHSENGSSGCRFFSDRGFTLIEVAFVLVIIGLLVGLGADLLPMLVKQNKFKENSALLREAKTAIVGYALATGRLPCASSNTNGTETAGRLSGYLPYAVLGINGRDAYTKTLYYAVDPYLTGTTAADQFKARLVELVNDSHPGDLFCDSGNFKAAFVVLSSGENLRADLPNDDNGNGIIDIFDNNQFALPLAPVTGTCDDILEAVSTSYLSGRFE